MQFTSNIRAMLLSCHLTTFAAIWNTKIGENQTGIDGHFLIDACGGDIISKPDPIIEFDNRCEIHGGQIVRSSVETLFENGFVDFGKFWLKTNMRCRQRLINARKLIPSGCTRRKKCDHSADNHNVEIDQCDLMTVV